jgi:hypothetical protein
MATTTASRPTLSNTLSKPAGAVGTAALLVLVTFAFAYKFPSATPTMAIGFVVLLAVVAWLLMSERYEWSLAILVLYLGLADGYLKLSTGSDSITLLRDVLLYSIVAGALIRAAVRHESIDLPPLAGWVIAWVLVVVVQLANPENGTFIHAVKSLRPHLEWVPLFFLGYMIVRNKHRLKVFLLLLLTVAAINGLVGLVQSNLTPTELGAWGPGYEQALGQEGNVSQRTFVDEKGEERNRPFGLGGDFGFGGVIGYLAIPAALGLLALSRSRGLRILAAMLAMGAVIGVATSAARTAVIAAFIAAFAYAALTVTSRAGLRSVMALGFASIVVYAALGILQSNTEESSFERYDSISNPAKAVSTAYDYRKGTLAQVPKYAVDIPLGAGLGSKGPAASLGTQTGGADLNGESEPTFLLIETGLPGFLVMIGFNLMLLYLAVTGIRQIGDRETRILLTAVAAPLFAIFATWFVGVSTATSPTSPYMWFAAGVLSYWLLGPGRESERLRPAAADPSPPRALVRA